MVCATSPSAMRWRRAARSAPPAREKAGNAAAAARAAAATEAAEREAARAAVSDAQATELRRVCREIEAGRDPYPEEDGR